MDAEVDENQLCSPLVVTPLEASSPDQLQQGVLRLPSRPCYVGPHPSVPIKPPDELVDVVVVQGGADGGEVATEPCE